MAPLTEGSQEIPVQIVGGSKFGRYDIIGGERTYNMFESDGWLVNFAGYRPGAYLIESVAEGRGVFHSVRGGFLLVVVAGALYRLNTISALPVNEEDLTSGDFIGALLTTTGEVFFDENLSYQIAIVDGSQLYIYNYDPTFGYPGRFGICPQISHLITGRALVPNYVTYQNSKFIVGNGLQTNEGQNFYAFFTASVNPTGLELSDPPIVNALQTKPDYAIACLRIPGKGNNMIVFGTTVAEIYQDIGSPTAYQRNSTVNIDYGCASVATIAASDEYVFWLGINEKSSPSLMVMSGGGAERISTDGIDFLLSTIKFPSDSTALFYRQDGHLFYILTFFNAVDDLSIAYDVTSKKFLDLTDWDSSFFPARQIVYFNNQSYFISLKNGYIYEFGTDITFYSVDAQFVYAIPRVRICDTQRFPRPEKFHINLFTFTIENGTEPGAYFGHDCLGEMITEDEIDMITEDGFQLLDQGGYCDVYAPRIDIRISKDGARTFSSALPYYMHETGYYNNQPRFNRLGVGNMFTVELRFWGFWRFIAYNGMLEISQ